MDTLYIILYVWIALVAIFTGLMVYRGHLTQHETDQLFLSENANHNEEEEHADIVRKVEILRPLCQGFGGAAALTTALLIGVYILDASRGMIHT